MVIFPLAMTQIGFAGKKLNTDADVFAAIRRWKDTEYD